MPQPFEAVRERLLRAGIPPRCARRYVTELREHLEDLTERERAAGREAGQAAERARTLLGSDALLAQAMMDHGAPRALAARAPCAVFAVLPVVLLVAALKAATALMIHALWPVRGLAPSAMPETYRAFIASMSFIMNDLWGLLLAAGCVAVAVRQRLTSSWMWVGIGLIAMFSAMLGFHVNVLPPHDGQPGSVIYSAAAIVYVHGRASLTASLAAAALHAALLFGLTAAAYLALQLYHRSPRPFAGPSMSAR